MQNRSAGINSTYSILNAYMTHSIKTSNKSKTCMQVHDDRLVTADSKTTSQHRQTVDSKVQLIFSAGRAEC